MSFWDDTGYAMDDPKHPTFHERYAEVWDNRDKSLSEPDKGRDGDRQAQERRALRVQRSGLGNTPDSPSPMPSSGSESDITEEEN